MKRKKGFTLVELIVVIAIIAVLATVSIIGYSNFIESANVSNDIDTVSKLNSFLDYSLQKHSTMHSSLIDIKDSGLNEDNVKNTYSKNDLILWDSYTDRFLLINKDNKEVLYPNSLSLDNNRLYRYFAIYDEMPTEQTYSIYATNSLTGDNGEVNLTVGFDQGSNVRINSLIYDRSTADSSRQVIIRTNNGTTCEFNGYDGANESDTIYHYGESGNQTISVGQHSFCEYGAATEVEVKKGHYVQETGSIVAIVNAKADYGDVIIDFKTGSIQGTVKNTNETNNVLINFDNNVTNVNFEGKIDGGNLEVNFSSQPTYVNVYNMVQEKDSDKPEVKISGLNTAIKSIPSYDDVTEENAECISVAGYSIKVYTNCNAYSHSKTMVDENIVKENTYTIKVDGDGDSITFNSSDDHIHTFGGPTWTWDGYQTVTATFVCTANDCNYTEKIVVPTKGGYITSEITKLATCCETGEKTYTAHLTHHNVQFANVSPNKEIIDIDVNAHSWGGWEITTQPTCLQKGVETRTCEHNNSHAQTRDVDALGHDLVHHVAKAATCTEIGWNVYDTCSRCNYTTYVEIPVLGHNYVSEVTNPTCTQQGYTTHTCLRCNDSYANTYVDALGHDFVNGICTRCGESNISIKFENTDKYLYRVGNKNSVATSSLFEGDISNIVITNIHGDACGNYVNGDITFNGTGVVKVTANDSVELLLEVVDAKNVTKYSELTNAYCVLLKDITMSNGGKYYLSNATLYGNGYTFDVTAGAHGDTNNGSRSNNYVVGLNNANLDNVKIIGKVYTSYGGTTKTDYNFPCVLANGGTCRIVNSYISNCASPVRATGTNLYFENTTLKGGVFCNLDIRGGVNVTINGLTTINQVSNNDAADNGTIIIGLGILMYYEEMSGNETITILNDSLVQYNWIADNQSGNAMSVIGYNPVSTIFNTVNLDYIYTDSNNVKWVNTGILSLTSSISSNYITTSNGYKWQNNISMLGKTGNLCTKLASAPAYPSDEYSPFAQYAVAPTASFEYPTASGKKNYLVKTDDSSEYCYWDSVTSSILVGFTDGKTFSFNPDILTITKNGSYITPQVKLDDDDYQAVCSNITITTAGAHTLTFKYTDPYNYDKDGLQVYDMEYTKTVKITATAAKASINPASFAFGSNGYKSVKVNNTTYVMPNVSATVENSIGSKTVGGNSIYYPIVYAQNSSGTGNASSAPVLCPIFKNVVTITDYDDNNNPIVYGASTTTMADGKLVAISDVTTGNSFLSWGNGGAPPDDNPCVVNKAIWYKSITISGVNRDVTTYTCEFEYTDNAGNKYHYIVGYIFPKLSKTCVTSGTLITLADGTQKMVEDLNPGDQLLVFNHLTGLFESGTFLYDFHDDNHDNTLKEVLRITFDNGNELEIIAQHRIFDATINQYIDISIDNIDQYINDEFISIDPISHEITKTKISNYEMYEDIVGSYSPVVPYYMNYIAGGMLNGVGNFKALVNYFDYNDDLSYNEEAMQQDIETYGLYDYEVFAEYVPYEIYEAFNGQYLKIAVEKGLCTFDEIIQQIKEYVDFYLKIISI